MTTLQAMLFGAMLAWTPSLVVLAVLLRDIPPMDDEQSPRECDLSGFGR